MNISSKQIEWVLDKAIPDIILSKQSIILDSDNLTDTFTITTNSDGNLSVVSSDDLIATVSLSGNTVTVEGLTNGTCTITVNVEESDNYIAGAKTLSIDAQLVSTTLNDNSWNDIKAVIQSGEAASLWNVGDTKEVILNGETTGAYGTKSYTSYSCYATILDFDHNANLETSGDHSIHFILGKDSTGKDICFYPYRMNDGDYTTDGGWNGSKMKQTTMVEFKNCLPVDLQAVLKNVMKYTHNTTGGSGNDNVNNVTASTEQLFLLSEYEVFGSRYHDNQYEQNKQTQYTYYANGNNKVRYIDTDPTSAIHWWLRSVFCYNPSPNCFCGVDYEGVATYYGTNVGIGISPVFVV